MNALSRARVQSASGAFFGTPSGSPSKTQQRVLEDLKRRVAGYGDRPEGMTPDVAMAAVAKSKDMYNQEPVNVAPFDIDLVRVAKGPLRPKAASLLPPRAAEVFRNFRTEILKDEAELESSPTARRWRTYDPSGTRSYERRNGNVVGSSQP